MTIISRASIRERAREYHEAGKGRDDHGHNPGAAAIFDYQEEWDRCEAVAKADRELCGVGA